MLEVFVKWHGTMPDIVATAMGHFGWIANSVSVPPYTVQCRYNRLIFFEIIIIKSDSRLAPSQWETSLQSNAVSYWLGANLESALIINTPWGVFYECKPWFIFWLGHCSTVCNIGSYNGTPLYMPLDNTCELIKRVTPYMVSWTWDTVVSEMACCIFGTMPLHEPKLNWTLGRDFTKILIKMQNLPFKKMHFKML